MVVLCDCFLLECAVIPILGVPVCLFWCLTCVCVFLLLPGLQIGCCLLFACCSLFCCLGFVWDYVCFVMVWFDLGWVCWVFSSWLVGCCCVVCWWFGCTAWFCLVIALLGFVWWVLCAVNFGLVDF